MREISCGSATSHTYSGRVFVLLDMMFITSVRAVLSCTAHLSSVIACCKCTRFPQISKRPSRLEVIEKIVTTWSASLCSVLALTYSD